ncbi:hypothetical protein P0D90_04700 [Pseudomonas sp. CBSPCBW29]|nr:hypothetical protein P0D90_04700 [Pseudomonas sp. CBSPCBW29]
MKTTIMEQSPSPAHLNQAPRVLLTKMGPECHSLKWLVTKDQLLSFWLEQQAYVIGLKGRHWMTSQGTDVCLEQGYFTCLAPGLILLQGEGEIALYLADKETSPAPAGCFITFTNTLSVPTAL